MGVTIRTAAWLMALTAAAALAGLALLTSGQPTADAAGKSSTGQLLRNANGGCENGDVCVWNQNDYSNCYRDMAADRDNYNQIDYSNCSSLALGDTVNSVKNRGQCAIKLFNGTSGNGAWVRFNSGWGGPDANPGQTIQDPMLSNGGGATAGDGWGTGSDMANKFESHDFCP